MPPNCQNLSKERYGCIHGVSERWKRRRRRPDAIGVRVHDAKALLPRIYRRPKTKYKKATKFVLKDEELYFKKKQKGKVSCLE